MGKEISIKPEYMSHINITSPPIGILKRFRALCYITGEKMHFISLDSALKGISKEIAWIETDQVSLFDYLDSEGTLVLEDVFIDDDNCPVFFIPFASVSDFNPESDLAGKRLEKLARKLRDSGKDCEFFNAV